MMRTVRDLLENLFGRSSTAERGAFFLLNVFISLCCSWWYSSWRLKLSRSLCLHSYGFISNSNIFSFFFFFFFLQKRHNKLTGWRDDIIFQWQVLTCQLKLPEGGSATSEVYLQAPPPFSLPRLPLGLLRHAGFFSFFSQGASVVKLSPVGN